MQLNETRALERELMAIRKKCEQLHKEKDTGEIGVGDLKIAYMTFLQCSEQAWPMKVRLNIEEGVKRICLSTGKLVILFEVPCRLVPLVRKWLTCFREMQSFCSAAFETGATQLSVLSRNQVRV